MKILFIIHALKFGGTERQLVELAKGLAARNHNVRIICIDKPGEGYAYLLVKSGIKIHYLRRSTKYDIKPVFAISRYIKQNQIDLVHTFENLGSLYGLIAAKFAKKPVICSAVRSAFDENKVLKISTLFIARYADILVANSHVGLANRFSKLKLNYRVVYNGIDLNRFKNNQAETRQIKEQLKVSKFKNIVGMVASLSHRKDHETLLKAIPRVIEAFPESCFLLIGDGKERTKLERLASKMGLDHAVSFLGYRNDVDKLIKVLDVAVLQTNTDIIMEGMSNSLLEMMASGIPVVASRGGGTDELIENNVNGLLVAPKTPDETARAIIYLLSNKEEAARLTANAKTHVHSNFSIQKCLSEYEKIYKEISNKN